MNKLDKFKAMLAGLPTQVIYDILRLVNEHNLTDPDIYQLIVHEQMHQWAANDPHRGCYPSLSVH